MHPDLEALNSSFGRRSIQIERVYAQKFAIMPPLAIASLAFMAAVSGGLVYKGVDYGISNLQAAALGAVVPVGFALPTIHYFESVKKTYQRHWGAAIQQQCDEMFASNPHINEENINAFVSSQKGKRPWCA